MALGVQLRQDYRGKFLAAWFTQEEIDLLIQETIINENDKNI